MRAGMADEMIAARLDISVDEVIASIQTVEAVRAALSNEMVDISLNLETLTAIDGIGDDLRDARQAVKPTGYTDGQGNPIYQRDWDTTLEAIRVAGTLTEKTRVKGGGIAVNVGINNNGGSGGSGGGQGRSFEALVRAAEQRKQLEAGPTVALLEEPDSDPDDDDNDIIEGDVEDVENDDENTPIGVQLDDPDEVDDDDDED